MSDRPDDFDEAYRRALAKHGVREWAALSSTAQLEAIFQELRAFGVGRQPDAASSGGSAHGMGGGSAHGMGGGSDHGVD